MKFITIRKMKLLICSTVLGLFAAQGAYAGDLKLSTGTIYLGGSAGFKYSTGDITQKGTLNVTVNLPFGYLVTDNLIFGFDLRTSIGLIDASNMANIGLGPLLDYVFETNSIVYPFVGGKFLLDWSKVNSADTKGTDLNRWRFLLTPEAGIFVALTQNAALGFSVEGEFSFPISQPKQYGFNGALGMVGVRAFF